MSILFNKVFNRSLEKLIVLQCRFGSSLDLLPLLADVTVVLQLFDSTTLRTYPSQTLTFTQKSFSKITITLLTPPPGPFVKPLWITAGSSFDFYNPWFPTETVRRSHSPCITRHRNNILISLNSLLYQSNVKPCEHVKWCDRGRRFRSTKTGTFKGARPMNSRSVV